MKDERINWRKINVIDYSGVFMTQEAKREYRKAFDIWCDCMHRGDFKKSELYNPSAPQKIELC